MSVEKARMHSPRVPARGSDERLNPVDAEKQRAPALSDTQMWPAAGWVPPEEVIWNSCLRWTSPYALDHLPAQ